MDILALNNSAFTDGYVEVLGERYRIKKANTDSYNVWANSFVWYGTLYDIESGESNWSISFILTNWALVEWTIRISKNSYYLTLFYKYFFAQNLQGLVTILVIHNDVKSLVP